MPWFHNTVNEFFENDLALYQIKVLEKKEGIELGKKEDYIGGILGVGNEEKAKNNGFAALEEENEKLNRRVLELENALTTID